MDESAVPAAGEIVIPRPEFRHPNPGRLRAGLRNAGHRPGHVPEISGVPGVALVAVAGERHAGEILGAIGFPDEVEEDGGHAVLAVVVVVLDPRCVVAVWDGTFADVKAQQLEAALDGEIELGILHPRHARHDERSGERHPGGVHHSVSDQAAVVPGELVAP